MYTLIRQPEARQHRAAEISALTLALLITELGVKLHSFTLECVVFLVLWYALSWLLAQVRRPLLKRTKLTS